MIYIGIDPGKKGGISFIGDEWLTEIIPMPATEKDVAKEFQGCADDSTSYKAVIEKVHAFPGQGVTSMFTFGQGYGFLRGVLVALAIPFTEVTSQKWMSYFGLKKKKGEATKQYKERILQKAQNLFPNSSVTLQTADSLMLAEYLRQRNIGYLNE